MGRGTAAGERAPLLSPLLQSDCASFSADNLGDRNIYKDDDVGHAADAPPWYERTTRGLVGVLFFVLVAGEVVPYILEMSNGFESQFVEQLSDHWGSIEPALLAALTLLAAAAGLHAHGKKGHPVSGKAAHLMVHAINLLPLVAAVISWW